jgi:xanthine/CO dehydrogenase XdhC/CoxF family maturation factor
MKEIRAELKLCWEQKLPCVVATIIQVDGSAYRKEGARCIIRQNGDILGILSGGCIEEDIKEHAFGLFQTGQSQKLFYDFRAGEDDLWGLGLGCNGAVTIWLELFDPVTYPSQAKAMLADFEARESCGAIYYAFTVLSSDPAGRYISGQRWSLPAGEAVEFELPSAAVAIITNHVQGERVELFVEKIEPAPRLSIIGVGADAALLSEMAKSFEWTVHIVYHETARADKRYFPYADGIIYIPRANYSSLAAYSDHYVVLMSHNLELDQEAVKQLLPKAEIAYLGLLGSQSRIRRIVEYVRSLVDFNPAWLQKLFSPIGLDIGAKTPQEITLSIMAEMIAHRNRRNGGSLADKMDFREQSFSSMDLQSEAAAADSGRKPHSLGRQKSVDG